MLLSLGGALRRLVITANITHSQYSQYIGKPVENYFLWFQERCPEVKTPSPVGKKFTFLGISKPVRVRLFLALLVP